MHFLRCISCFSYIFPLLTETVGAGLWFCHSPGAAGDRSAASTDSTGLPGAAVLGLKGADCHRTCLASTKLGVLLELLLLQKEPGSFPGTCCAPWWMRARSQHIWLPFSCFFLPSFWADTCLPSHSSNGNFACAAQLICLVGQGGVTAE